MKGEENLRRAMERGARAVQLRPSVGQGTALTRVQVYEGVRCEIEDGAWRLDCDMSEKSGGTGSGPDPGVYGRSALGACMAICYVQWGIRLGVPIEGVSVEVHADYDTRGEHGLDGVPAGYSQVRCQVRIESDAPAEEVRRLVAKADSHSPYYDVFTRPIEVRSEVDVVKPGS